MKAAFLLPRREPLSLLDDPVLFARDLARALEKEGHGAELLAPPPPGGEKGIDLGKRLGGAGFPSLGRNLERADSLRRALKKGLREGAWDLLEVFWVEGWEAWAPCLAGTPFLGRFPCPFPGSPPGRPGSLDSLVGRFFGRSAAGELRGFSALSSHHAGRVREELGARCIFRVIHPGLDPTPFLEVEPLPLEGGPSRVLCLLGGDEEEGLFLARALGPVLESREEPEVLVWTRKGDSPAARAFLEELRDRAGRPDRIRLEGAPRVGKLPGLLRESRALLATSFQEGGLYLLLAAMAAARPVLVPALPWIYEYVRPEIDGLVLPAGEAEAWTSGLDRVLRDGGLVRLLGEGGRSRVEARFRAGECARASLGFWSRTILPRDDGGLQEEPFRLDPGNWFHAWWVEGGGERKTLLREEPAGHPVAADLSLEEMGFLFRFLSRAWWDQGGAWDSPVAEFLSSLDRLLEEKSSRDLAGPPGKRARESGLLSLPPLDHPLFETPLGGAFLEESWSVRDLSFFREWLEEECRGGWFLEKGIENPVLRKMVVLFAADHPSETLFSLLRRAYRESRAREALLGEDRVLFEEEDRDGSFRKAVEKLGLHLPLERPPVFPVPPGKGAPSSKGSGPAVTVLVPSYKHEDFIRAALESVLGQTYPEVRVLVVDDCSPDGTAEKARELDDPRITVEVNERNLGLGESILSVLPEVDTPYTAILNSDDLFHPDRIAACVEALEMRPDAALAATEMVFADGKGRVLDRENTPLVEVGPRVRDLVSWYENEIRFADPPLDRTSLEGLVRHNHLLTSSNIFCRTEYLKEKSGVFRGLLYTVDWSLFLEGAREGRLLFLEEPLLAYRLHERNTMWFQEESRPGYVLEIHRLLSSFFERLGRDGRGEEAAKLLLREAGKHGEVGGWFLSLAGLDLLPGGKDLPPWLLESLERIRPEKFLLREAHRVGLDWRRIGNLLWEAERSLPARTAVQLCRREKAGLEGKLAWVEGAREEFRRWAEDEAAQGRRLAGENRKLWETLEELRAREAGLREEVARLEGRARELEGALRESRAEVEDLRRERERLEEELAGRESELLRVREAVRALEEALGREREERHREREAFLEEGRRARAWMRETRYLLHLERTGKEEALQWQVGAFLLDRMRLRRPVKALLSGWRTLGAGLTRIAASAAGGKGLVLAWPEGSSSHAAFPAALEAEFLEREGVKVEAFRWKRSGARSPGRERFLHQDPFLQNRDRSWFFRRKRSAAEKVDALPLEKGNRDRLYTFARTLLAGRAGCVQAQGLGFSLWEAYAAHLLCGIPWAASLSPFDLVLLERERETWAPLLERASLLLVENEAGRKALAELLPGGTEERILVRGPLPWNGGGRTGPGQGPLKAVALGTVVHERELNVIPDALAVALEAGADVEVCFLGGPREDPDGLEAWDWFRGRVYNQGLEGKFRFLDGLTPASAAGLLAGADLLLEGRLREGAPEGAAFLVGALGVGLPAAAPAEPPLREAAPLEGLFLYQPGDAGALGAVLAELAADPEKRVPPPSGTLERFVSSRGIRAWIERLRGLVGRGGEG